MPWMKDIIAAFTGKNVNIDDIKRKVQGNDEGIVVSDAELKSYIDDLGSRIKKMEKDLKDVYSQYNIEFNGFRSFALASTSLRNSLKEDKEQAYNNLIKLESSITSEQKRHLGLIKMAVTRDGKKVIDKIMQDPKSKEQFYKIFGTRDVAGQPNIDGTYQILWSEIHHLVEYIIKQKNKVYH